MLQTHGKDRYGRTLGDALLPDGTNIKHTLVKQGWCWWYLRYTPGNTATPTCKNVGLRLHPLQPAPSLRILAFLLYIPLNDGVTMCFKQNALVDTTWRETCSTSDK